MTSSYGINFADAETPQKLGSKFVLEHPPAPPVSLQLFRNGSLQSVGEDYQLAGSFIAPLSDWASDDEIVAFYRF